MKNFMVEDMCKRISQYYQTDEFINQAALNLYYWVMCVIESLFWAHRDWGDYNVELYLREGVFHLIYSSNKGKEYDYDYYPIHDLSGDNLIKVIELFSEILNNIKRPLPDRVLIHTSTPSLVSERNIVKKGKYKGYYKIRINFDVYLNLNQYWEICDATDRGYI